MTEIVPEQPWDYQRLPGHDLLQTFINAHEAAENAGADLEDAIQSGLMEVLRIMAWEMDEMPLPAEQPDKRTMLIQHVLHRLGDQGNGQRNA